MRTLALTLATALLFGCGGKKTPAAKDAMTADASNPDGPAPDATDAPGVDAATAGDLGTSGYPGLDWGASLDDLKAKFPRAAPGTENLSITGDHAGKPGVTTFEDESPSMEECATVWKEMRATLDGKLGASQSDNLAAYWESPTYNITLSCDPGDEDAGMLSMSYSQPQP